MGNIFFVNKMHENNVTHAKMLLKLRNDVFNLFVKTHIRIKIYGEFYHGVIYIANEVRNVRIIYKIIFLLSCKKNLVVQMENLISVVVN